MLGLDILHQEQYLHSLATITKKKNLLMVIILLFQVFLTYTKKKT